MYYICKVKQLNDLKMKTLKTNSRIDTQNGYLITKKEYPVQIIKVLKFNFALVKIGKKVFTTDLLNIK